MRHLFVNAHIAKMLQTGQHSPGMAPAHREKMIKGSKLSLNVRWRTELLI
jgi:hypothetical protein